jgi:hypothetical protein
MFHVATGDFRFIGLSSSSATYKVPRFMWPQDIICSSLSAGFQVFWSMTMLYFSVDFFWILTDPLCVKNPSNILWHHLLSALFTMWPFFYPQIAIKMSYVMTVEVQPYKHLCSCHCQALPLMAFEDLINLVVAS